MALHFAFTLSAGSAVELKSLSTLIYFFSISELVPTAVPPEMFGLLFPVPVLGGGWRVQRLSLVDYLAFSKTYAVPSGHRWWFISTSPPGEDIN